MAGGGAAAGVYSWWSFQSVTRGRGEQGREGRAAHTHTQATNKPHVPNPVVSLDAPAERRWLVEGTRRRGVHLLAQKEDDMQTTEKGLELISGSKGKQLRRAYS